jgi:multiple sugar transport system ATP-binding protein
MARVELEGITKRYGSAEACSDITLDVADGEFVTLLGPSGCGKTTTLNLIAGLDDPSEGEIRMDGRVVNDLTPFERDVAMVFQNYALYPHMTVEENIGFTLRLRRRPRDEIRGRVASVAETLELTPVMQRLPKELSGGQQQRVALGRAVIREPAVFLFDEPFSNLDAALRIRMRIEVKELHQRLGITSLFVTHDQEEALSLSDRIVVMRSGCVEQIGTPEEVYLHPASRYVGRFIGSPQMDVLEGELVTTGGNLEYRVGSQVFPIPEEAAPRTDSPVDLGVRPEHIKLNEGIGVPMEVHVVQPLGSMTYVTVGWDDYTLTSRVLGMGRFRPGEFVAVSLDPSGLLFFDRKTGSRLSPRGARSQP